MAEVVYKLRHKPTGYFYQAAKGNYRNRKSNLSKTGKIYSGKTYPNPLRGRVNVSDTLVKKLKLTVEVSRYRDNMLMTTEQDWEVVEFELIEKTK